MKKYVVTAPQALGLLLAVFGAVLVGGWIVQSERILRWLPGAVEMGLNVPLLFLIAGLCSFSLHGEVRRPARASPWFKLGIAILLALPALTLIEHVFTISLGIDFVRTPTAPSETMPHPGRMSPNASLGFLFAGCALVFIKQRLFDGAGRMAIVISITAVMAIGFSALAGYALNLETFYRIASMNRMQAPTAAGMSLLGINLWLLRQSSLQAAHASKRYEKDITYRAIAVLTLMSLLAGITGFAVMQESFDQALADNFHFSATTNATALTDILEDKTALHRTLAERPLLQQALTGVQGAAAKRRNDRLLQQAAADLMTSGLSGVAIHDAGNRLVHASGVLIHGQAEVNMQFNRGSTGTKLLWRDGYWLRTDNPVIVAGQAVGRVVAEQRLASFDRILLDIRTSGDSTDAVLCSRDGDMALCTPSRFYAQALRVPMFRADGSVNLPGNHALLGQSGVRFAIDARGISVMAAYTPLSDLGLALVIKTDTASLYAPLKGKLKLLALLLVGVIVLGTIAMRMQVRPLLKRLVQEEKRTRVILENSNDAFIAVGADRLITDWNPEAERIFGWPASQAIGRRLSELAMPPALRYALDAGFQQFLTGNHGAVLNRRIETSLLHRDGRELPVEISIAIFHNGQGYVANAFLRDISERKLAEEKLAGSERRLRAIADNLPVLISYIDRDHKFRFCNKTFEQWLGVSLDKVLDTDVSAALGPALYGERRAQIEQALAGQRIEFDITSTALGIERHLHTTYVPDIARDGTVAGIYTLSIDVSALKKIEQQLSQLARFDSLTGLPNRYQMNEKLIEAIARSRRANAPMAVMFLDIDHFKSINDNYGHAAGDEVLKEFARRLKASVRETDVVCRLAGDEFVIILEQVRKCEEAESIARKIIANVTARINLQDLSLKISTSVGIAFCQGLPLLPDALIEQADDALYQAKEAGRNTYRTKLV